MTILGSNFQDVYALRKTMTKGRKVVRNQTDLRLQEHITALREHRVQLRQTLSQLRDIVHQHAGLGDQDEDTVAQQNVALVWGTVEFVVINGLSRIEDLLATVQVQQSTSAASNIQSGSTRSKSMVSFHPAEHTPSTTRRASVPSASTINHPS